jgi:hypothetical protein
VFLEPVGSGSQEVRRLAQPGAKVPELSDRRSRAVSVGISGDPRHRHEVERLCAALVAKHRHSHKVRRSSRPRATWSVGRPTAASDG